MVMLSLLTSISLNRTIHFYKFQLHSTGSSPRRTVAISPKGVCYAKKDYNLAKHPDIDVPNLQLLSWCRALSPKEYVRQTFAWLHYYWYLTKDGIDILRTYLNLPSEIVPATLKKSARPCGRPLGGPQGDLRYFTELVFEKLLS